jgi:heme/copper-type cytochrome/quinol oxidase subunit 2
LALAGDSVAGHWKRVSSDFTVVTVVIAVIVVAVIVRWAIRRRKALHAAIEHTPSR